MEFIYWRSALTGNCYCSHASEGLPLGAGWEPITEEAYDKWCKRIGLELEDGQ